MQTNLDELLRVYKEYPECRPEVIRDILRIPWPAIQRAIRRKGHVRDCPTLDDYYNPASAIDDNVREQCQCAVIAVLKVLRRYEERGGKPPTERNVVNAAIGGIRTIRSMHGDLPAESARHHRRTMMAAERSTRLSEGVPTYDEIADATAIKKPRRVPLRHVEAIMEQAAGGIRIARAVCDEDHPRFAAEPQDAMEYSVIWQRMLAGFHDDVETALRYMILYVLRVEEEMEWIEVADWLTADTNPNWPGLCDEYGLPPCIAHEWDAAADRFRSWMMARRGERLAGFIKTWFNRRCRFLRTYFDER